MAKVVLTYTYEGAPNYLGAVVVDDEAFQALDVGDAMTGTTPEVTAFAATTLVPQDATTVDSYC